MFRNGGMTTLALGGVVVALLCLDSTPAFATSVSWTDWTAFTVGNPGSAAGLLNGVSVSYAGQVIPGTCCGGTTINGTSPIWNPASSFIGGTVDTSPSTVGDAIALNGSFTGVNTITFATPVVDPVFAIWSLGAPGVAATFTFVSASPTFEAGGPNSLFGGAPIGVAGNVVTGSEGNGVVQFTGTFTTLSWTNSFENFYAFTVGVNGAPTPVPEPTTLALIALGLAGHKFASRRRAH